MLLRNGKCTCESIRKDDFGDKLMFVLIMYTFLAALHFCVAMITFYTIKLLLRFSE